MEDKQNNQATAKQEKEQVPVITGNFSPLRLVMRDQDVWDPSIDDINRKTYDYVKLHRLSTFIDIGIAPFSMAVCFDGTFALPAIEKYRTRESALETFNRVLAEILLGGVYVEAMAPDDLCLGRLTYDGYCRSYSASEGSVARFHSALRTKHVSILEVMKIFQPQTISVERLQEVVAAGRTKLSAIGPVSPETLLYGSTFYARHQWAEALIHLWTSAEQIIEILWRDQIVNGRHVTGLPKKSRKQFLQDTRTWTSSARIELLFQLRLLPDETCAHLDRARKARNEFVHTGKKPSRGAVEAGLIALFQLASLKTSEYKDYNCYDDSIAIIREEANDFRDWEKAREPIPVQAGQHWLPIPPIPGDVNWGDKPYEVIDDLRLAPLKVERA